MHQLNVYVKSSSHTHRHIIITENVIIHLATNSTDEIYKIANIIQLTNTSQIIIKCRQIHLNSIVAVECHVICKERPPIFTPNPICWLQFAENNLFPTDFSAILDVSPSDFHIIANLASNLLFTNTVFLLFIISFHFISMLKLFFCCCCCCAK